MDHWAPCCSIAGGTTSTDRTPNTMSAFGQGADIANRPIAAVWRMVENRGMTPIAQAMLYAFIAIWIAAVVTWVVGVANFLPVWWALARRRRPEGRQIKWSLISAAAFAALVVAGIGVGAIAELAGGWG